MLRRAAFLLPLALAACGDAGPTERDGPWVGTDPVMTAALLAIPMLSDTSRFANDPAEAARATVQMEWMVEGLTRDPIYAPVANGAAVATLRRGQAELREAIGIAPDAPPRLVIGMLRDAEDALRQGDRQAAAEALDGRAFPAGGAAAVERLSNLPFLPRVRAAAAAGQSEIQRIRFAATARGA
jgi:hypothetical protein